MAANPFFSGRIPPNLYQRVEDFCKKEGKGKTEFMIEAFCKYLDLPVPTTVSSSEITKEMFLELQERMSQAEAQIKKLEKLIKIRIQSQNNDNVNISTDNKNNYIENIEKFKNYEFINHKKLPEVARIKTTEAQNLKVQAFSKAEKEGYEIKENTNFRIPIEMIFKKGITIDNKKFKIFCKGIDENKYPIWNLIECDNDSYQTVIALD